MKNEIANTWTQIAIDEIYEESREISIRQNIKLSILGALDEYAESLEPKRVPDLFHPGGFIKEEMEARSWDFKKLCLEMGMQPSDVAVIFDKKFIIGTHEAEALEKAFGSSAQEWLGLQATYNAGISIEKMKEAEDLAGLTIKLNDVVNEDMDIREPDEYCELKKQALALARKITEGV